MGSSSGNSFSICTARHQAFLAIKATYGMATYGRRETYPGGVQQVVGARRFDDLGLLLNSEVLPGEVGVDVLLVELQDFIVADGARVGVVHDACQLPLGLHSHTSSISC